jgi:hypothetical protein
LKSCEAKRINRGYLAAVLARFTVICSAATEAQDVQTFVSSKAGDRISPKPVPRFEQDRDPSSVEFEINEDVTYQKIHGFGCLSWKRASFVLTVCPLFPMETVHQHRHMGSGITML